MDGAVCNLWWCRSCLKCLNFQRHLNCMMWPSIQRCAVLAGVLDKGGRWNVCYCAAGSVGAGVAGLDSLSFFLSLSVLLCVLPPSRSLSALAFICFTR